MKFQRLDTASCSDEHQRFVMHIGREETKILLALLAKARTYTPRLQQTTMMLGRVRQMEREFRKHL